MTIQTPGSREGLSTGWSDQRNGLPLVEAVSDATGLDPRDARVVVERAARIVNGQIEANIPPDTALLLASMVVAVGGVAPPGGHPWADAPWERRAVDIGADGPGMLLMRDAAVDIYNALPAANEPQRGPLARWVGLCMFVQLVHSVQRDARWGAEFLSGAVRDLHALFVESLAPHAVPVGEDATAPFVHKPVMTGRETLDWVGRMGAKVFTAYGWWWDRHAESDEVREQTMGVRRIIH